MIQKVGKQSSDQFDKQSTSKHASTESPVPREGNVSETWRVQLTKNSASLDIWKILQRVEPDQETRAIREKIRKLSGYEQSDVKLQNLASRIRHWQLSTGLSVDELISIVEHNIEGLDSLKPIRIPRTNGFLRHVLNYPLTDLNKAVKIGAGGVGAIFKHVKPTTEEIEKICDSIDHSLSVVDLAVSISEVWSIDAQIEAAEYAVKPVENESEAQELDRKIEVLQAELKRMNEEKIFIFQPERLAKVQQLLLLKAKRHPELNQEFLTMMKREIEKLKKAKEQSQKNVSAAAFALSAEGLQLALGALDPTGISSKIFATALKTKSLWQNFSGVYDTFRQIRESKERRTLANHSIKVLSEHASTPEEKQLCEIAKKAQKVYWHTKTGKLGRTTTLKSLGFIGAGIGLSVAVLKILAIVGVIAAGATTIATLGYAGLIIAGAILLLKLSFYIYENRQQISLYLQKIWLSTKDALYQLAQKLGFNYQAELTAIRGRFKEIEKSFEHLELAEKTNGVSKRVLRQLSRSHLATVKSDEESILKAKLIVKAITGKEAKYLEKVEDARNMRPEEINDRMLASLIDALA